MPSYTRKKPPKVPLDAQPGKPGYRPGKAKVDPENPPAPEIHELEPDAETAAIYRLRNANEGNLATVPLDEHHPNGKVIFRTMVRRNQRESALERLHNAGLLGSSPEAEIRYLAGCWLREVFVAAHPGADMLARLNSAIKGGIRTAGVGGWSDMKVAEVFLIGKVLAKIKAPAAAVEAVCCSDSADVQIAVLRRGLERLAYVLCHPKRSEIDLRDIDTGKETLAQLRERFAARQRTCEEWGREQAGQA